jgi:acetyl esterase/lipase
MLSMPRFAVSSGVFRLVLRTSLSFAAVLAGVAVVTYLRPEIYGSLFGERDVGVTSDVAYGPAPRQRLDVYRPPESVAEHNAVVVFLYGGSWKTGDKALYGFVGQALAARGFTTVIPDYRLYPEVQFPAFFEDAAKAYAWTERTLARHCAPPRPVIVAGHSAGAHMAAMLALNPAYIKGADAAAARPAAFIGLAGPYTFQPTQWPSTKDAFATAESTPEITRPVSYIGKDAPPALLLHGLSDQTVQLKNLRELTAALTAAGDHVETEAYPNIGHIGLVLALSRPFRWRAPVLQRIVDFASHISVPANDAIACK